jgi:hypothetical protein
MAVNFPASLDTFTNPASNSSVANPSHSQQHSDANDAIEALEAKVGITGSAVTTSHDYRISQVESLVTSAVSGAKSIYQDVRNQSGSSLSKATPVYVSGSEGASGKMLISAASNSAESTSSKTMGITTSAIANNSNGQVISEGILEGIDTTGAADGDPVWLGTNGAKIYGLANKPSAPSHLVFLGVVIRGGQANTGSMYVKIQNGFELEELHNVQISSLINGNIIAYDSTAGTWKNTNTLQATSSVVPLIVKGNGYSVNAFEMRNSSGELRAYINPYGSIVSLASANYFISDNPTNTVLTVKGISSQSANLQEWQNSSGSVLGSINYYGGAAFAGYINFTTNAQGIASGNSYVIRVTDQQNLGLATISFGGGARVIGIANAATVPTSNSFDGGILYAENGALKFRGSGGVSAQFEAYSATDKPLVLKGYASQTANLQEWQDSNGTTLSRVGSGGDFYSNAMFGYYLRAGTQSFVDSTSLRVHSYGSAPNVVIKNTVGTYDLTQWQNSAGTILAKVNSVGDIDTSGIVGAQYAAFGASRSYVDNVALRILTNGSNVGIIVKGYSGTTANLQEWQTSSGTVKTFIKNIGGTNNDLFGWVNSDIISGTYFAPTASTSAIMTLTSDGALISSPGVSKIGLTVQGAASQTANLQEWKNSTGTVLAAIASDGKLNLNTSGTGYINLGDGQIYKGPGSGFTFNSDIYLINGKAFYGAGLYISTPTNTTNAATVYNAAGTPVFNVDTSLTAVNLGGGLSGIANSYGSSWGYDSSVNAGYITFQTGALGSDSLAIRRTNHVASGDYTISTLGNMRFSTASGKNFNFNSGNIGVATTAIGTNNKIIVNPYSTVDNLATVQVNTNSASNKGLVVQGYASQTANLQEWQDSAGIGKAFIMAGGTIGTTGDIAGNYGLYLGGGSLGSYIGSALSVKTWSANIIGSIIRGAASQTANLQEWQNSSGNIIAQVDAYGSASFGGNNTLTSSLGIGVSGNPNQKGITIRGTTSQAANLQEWQNSSGTILANIDASGQASFKSTTLTASSSGGSSLTLVAASGQTAPLLTTAGGAQITAGGNYFKAPGIEATYVMNVTSGASGVIPLTVKGAASQIADLQQWQDSSSSTLAKVDSGGTFAARAFAPTGYVTSNSAGGTYTNYWCKIADYTLPSQYTDAVSYMDFSLNGPGFTYVVRGKVYVRVKQQNAMGSAPETPTLVVYNGDGNGFNATDFALVVVQNDSSLTKYELYYKLPYDWASLVSTPTFKVGLINYYSQILPVASLPSGTKTYGRNADAKFNSVTITPEANNAINLIVKPVAGQTYNLQEWQNSSGNIISYVTSSGAIASNTSVTATSFVKNGGTSSQFLKADGSVDSSTYVSTSSSYIAGHHPEGRILASAALVNDLGNARLRGSTFTFTNISPADVDIDKMFDGTANFLMVSPTSSQTFPIVIEFTLPRTLSWGAIVGVGFGLSTWRANSVKIEAFSNGAWVTCVDTTTNTSEDVIAGIPGPNSNGTTKLRYTFANPNSSQLRICHLWAYNYNSDMWTQLQMPRSGGTMYGALSTKGVISVLDSSNTATISLNQDGSGAVAKADPYGGTSWNSYGNLGVRTAGSSGGYSGIVTIGSATQASSTPALVLRGHTEPNSLTNSSPLQVWQKADGVLLAKIDQFGAFTVNVNSASSIPLILKGASSQTANLQEWQNSSGIVKVAINSDGAIRFDDQTNSPIIKWGNATVWEAVGGTASMRINPYGPGYIGLIVKGFASQTASLQEWQSSDGTILAVIAANGGTSWRGGYNQFGGDVRVGTYSYYGGALSVGARVASEVGTVIRGAASQTANLQEWQDSSGTTQAFVRYDGFINTNNSLRVAGDNISAYRFQGVSDGNYTMNFPGSGNIQLFSAVNDTGSGVGVLGIKNATTAPTSNPTTGGILYVSSGALIYRGTGGAITTIARSGNESSIISANTATTVDTIALSSFTTIEYTISIKQGSKIRSSKVLVHTDGTSVDSTEYGIMEMGGGITGVVVSASVSSTNSILQVTITDAATTNATVKLIKTML